MSRTSSSLKLTLSRRFCTAPDNNGEKLRELLRNTAQPVSVVTVKMPSKSSQNLYHGATLSSFTSIAMEPHPLISFALKTPSRLATALRQSFPHEPSDMVISLLAAEQATVSEKFSRPDLYPEPFRDLPYSLSQEGLPILRGSLGSISCKLVSPPLPLHDLRFLDALGRSSSQECSLHVGGGIASELFIARVLRVEERPTPSAEWNEMLPLLYHRRGYTTCLPKK